MAVVVAGLSLALTAWAHSFRELSAGSTATSGGRRRKSQLGGPAARWVVGRQGWLIGPTFPSQGPHLTSLSQVPTPTHSPHLVPAIKGITAHCRNTFPLNRPGCDLTRLLSITMTVWGPGTEGGCWELNPMEGADRSPRLQKRRRFPARASDSGSWVTHPLPVAAKLPLAHTLF